MLKTKAMLSLLTLVLTSYLSSHQYILSNTISTEEQKQLYKREKLHTYLKVVSYEYTQLLMDIPNHGLLPSKQVRSRKCQRFGDKISSHLLTTIITAQTN